jgi:hypothetical protein
LQTSLLNFASTSLCTRLGLPAAPPVAGELGLALGLALALAEGLALAEPLGDAVPPADALGEALAAGRILAEVLAVLVELADGDAFAEGLPDTDGVALGEVLALAPGTGVLVAP